MSCSIALRRSPKPGALTAQELKVPRILLRMRVASASPSTSSATISSGLPVFMTRSAMWMMSCWLETLPEVKRMYGWSSTAVWSSGLVTK